MSDELNDLSFAFLYLWFIMQTNIVNMVVMMMNTKISISIS